MTTDPTELLRQWIQEADAAIPDLRLHEVAGTPTGAVEDEQPTDDQCYDQEWLMPISNPTEASLRSPHRPRLIAAAALLLIAVGFGTALLVTGSEDALTEAEGMDTNPAQDTAAREVIALTPLEVVEARYRAMEVLDLPGIHAAVAPDVTHCQQPRPHPRTFEECVQPTITYYGFAGWGERYELAAIRAHAYGGQLDYSCSAEATVVTCEQTETHLLLQAAGAQRQPIIMTFTIVDGLITSINRQQPEATGLVDSQIQTQVQAYGNWVATEHPERHDMLFALGSPILKTTTAEEHRRLVTEWLST